MSLVDRVLGIDEPAAPEPEGDPLEDRVDDLFVALSNRRRRFIIDNLADRDDDEWVTIGELTEAIALIEHDDAERFDELSSADRKRVYVALYQTHFPKLSGWDLLDYDDRANRVRKTAGTMAARRLLQKSYQEVSGGVGWWP